MTPALPRTPAELTALLDAVEARARRAALADGMDVQRKAFADAFALLSPVLKAFDPGEKRGGDGRWTAGGANGDTTVTNGNTPHPDRDASARDLTAGLAEKLPPGVWDKVGDKVLTAAAHVYGAMLRATPAAMRAMRWFEELGDTPHDLTRLGYAPATAGTASAAATARMDPVRGATGGLVSTHVAATVASHLLGRAYVFAKRKLGGQQKAYTDGFAEAGALVAEMLGAVHDALGLDGGVPTPEEIAAALRTSGQLPGSGAVEKAHRRRLVLKAVTHAPKGGATVNGKEYAGGEFIPASEMAKASDEEKAALGVEDEPEEWDGEIADSAVDVGGSWEKLPDGEHMNDTFAATRPDGSKVFGKTVATKEEAAAEEVASRLAAAKTDPKKAAELRQRVTDPEQRKKLDAHLGGGKVGGRPRGPKGGDYLLNVVKRYGGINSKSHDLLKHYEDMRRAVQDGLPIQAFSKDTYNGLDTLAEQLASDGHISVPPGKDPGEHLLDQLRDKAYSLHADLSDQYEKAEADHYRLLQEAHDDAERTGADRSEIEGAVRLGEAAGRAAGAEGSGGTGGEDGGRDDSEPPEWQEPAGDVDASFDFGFNTSKVNPRQLDRVTATHDAVRQHLAGNAPDRHKKIAELLAGHTVAELHELKRQLGLRASGNKADLVNKISLRAAGMSVPTEGYTGRLRTRDGKTQIWQRGRLLGTIDNANPSAGGRERVPVEHAHDRIRAMHADGSLHTPEGRQQIADMLTHQMTIPDLHDLKRRLGLKASGRKAELVRKLTERAGGAARREDAMEASARERDLADAMASREPADTFRTDAHAQEADEAAAEKRDRMQAWAHDKPGSVAAEDAARRAQGRAGAGRDPGATPKPGGKPAAGDPATPAETPDVAEATPNVAPPPASPAPAGSPPAAPLSVAGGFTPEQASALRDYTDPGKPVYAKLNAALRGRSDYAHDFARHDITPEDRAEADRLHRTLQAAFRDHATAPDHPLYRGLSLTGDEAAKVLADARASLESGRPYAQPGYMSTSADRDTADSFAMEPQDPEKDTGIVFQIKPSSALPLESVAAEQEAGSEREFLLPHNSRFRVVGITPAKNKYNPAVVEVEQLPPAAPLTLGSMRDAATRDKVAGIERAASSDGVPDHIAALNAHGVGNDALRTLAKEHAAGGIDPAAVLADAVQARTGKTYTSGGQTRPWPASDTSPADVAEAARRHRAGNSSQNPSTGVDGASPAPAVSGAVARPAVETPGEGAVKAKEPHEMTRAEYEDLQTAIPKVYGPWNDEVGEDRYSKPLSRTDQVSDKVVKQKMKEVTPGGEWPFPPVVVRRDAGPYDLKDGHHRIEIAKRLGVRVVPATLTDPRAFGHTRPVNTFVEIDGDGEPRIVQPNNESLPPISVTVPETKPGKNPPDHGKAHRAAVKASLAAGKPVPAHVLADYPDLARRKA